MFDKRCTVKSHLFGSYFYHKNEKAFGNSRVVFICRIKRNLNRKKWIHIIFFSTKPREISSSWFIISGLNFLSWWAFQTFSCCSYPCCVNIIFISLFVERNFPWKLTKVAWNVIILFPWKFWWFGVSITPLFTDLMCTSLYKKGNCSWMGMGIIVPRTREVSLCKTQKHQNDSNRNLCY